MGPCSGIAIVYQAADQLGAPVKKRLIRFRFVLGVLTLLSIQACPLLVIAALPADMTQAGAAEGLHVALTITGVAAKTGDHATITATVTNTTRQPVHGATLFLGLVDMTPGQLLPLGLEGWTSEPESRGLAPLVPGGSASATWDLVMIQPGPLWIYASVITGPSGPIESGPLAVLSIKDVRILNPANVLPVALGEPLALIGVVLTIRYRRQRQAC